MSSSSHSRLSSPSKSSKTRSGTTADASKSESKDVVPELKSPTRKIKKKSTSAEEASSSTEKTEVDSVIGSPKSSDKKKIKKKTKTTGDNDAAADGANEDKAKRSSSVKRSSSSKRTTSKSPSPRSRRTEDSGAVENGELADSPTKSRRKGTKLSSKEEPPKDVSSGASSRGRSRSPMPGVTKSASDDIASPSKGGKERLLRSPVGKDKTVDTDTMKQLNEKNAEIEQLRAELAALKGKAVPNGPKSILKEDPSQQERAIFEKDATIASQREIIDRLKKDLIALENDGSGKKYKARLAAAEVENSTLMATMASERREARIKLEEKDELIASLRREVAKLGGNPGQEAESNSQHMRSDPPEELNDMSAKSLDLLYAIREDSEMTGAEPTPKRMSGTKKPTNDKVANDDPSSKSKSSGSIGKLFGMSKSRSKEKEPKKSKTPPVELRHKSKRAPRTESSPPVF